MDLIIFITTGVTHRFHRVKILREKEGRLTFDYVGLSTVQERVACFTNYAGYSFCEEKIII